MFNNFIDRFHWNKHNNLINNILSTITVTRYASMDKWLFAWYGNGNVYRNIESIVYWHAVCTGDWVSFKARQSTLSPFLKCLAFKPLPNKNQIRHQYLTWPIYFLYNYVNEFLFTCEPIIFHFVFQLIRDCWECLKTVLWFQSLRNQRIVTWLPFLLFMTYDQC